MTKEQIDKFATLDTCEGILERMIKSGASEERIKEMTQWEIEREEIEDMYLSKRGHVSIEAATVKAFNFMAWLIEHGAQAVENAHTPTVCINLK
jgi:uncharacterized membrane protein YjjP (DUF1212 family)